LGVLVKRGFIDVAIVDDLMSGQVVSFWEKFRPIYVEARRRRNWPQLVEWVEYLYREVKGIMEKQNPTLVGKDVAVVR
jgi:hypothetical protein